MWTALDSTADESEGEPDDEAKFQYFHCATTPIGGDIIIDIHNPPQEPHPDYIEEFAAWLVAIDRSNIFFYGIA